MSAEHFDDWSQAFDACRERNRPLMVIVDGQRAKVFPSGRSEDKPPVPDLEAFGRACGNLTDGEEQR